VGGGIDDIAAHFFALGQGWKAALEREAAEQDFSQPLDCQRRT